MVSRPLRRASGVPLAAHGNYWLCGETVNVIFAVVVLLKRSVT
jgi:hypothetical protein